MATDSQRDLLTQIFQAQRRALIGTLYRMVGCLYTAEDLAHDAYLRVAKAARERPVTHLQAFLYQTARNLALDHLRRERLRGTFMSETPDGTADAVAAPQPTQETAVMDAQNLNRVEGALAALPARAPGPDAVAPGGPDLSRDRAPPGRVGKHGLQRHPRRHDPLPCFPG